MTTTSDFLFEEVVSENQTREFVEIRNRMMPSWETTYDEFMKEDSVWPEGKLRSRFLIRQDGNTIGTCSLMEAHWQADSGLFEIGWLTEDMNPERLCDHLQHLEALAKERKATKLETWLPEHMPWMGIAAAQFGFKSVQMNPESELDLDTFDSKPFQSKVVAVEQSGLTVMSLAQLADVDPDGWIKRYWDAEWELFQDVPVPWEKKKSPLDEFAKRLENEKESWPTMLVAMEGEEIVATTMLFRSVAVPTKFYTGLTAVGRNYRRTGLATALKVINLDAAKALGGKVVMADNEQDNPMLDLNLALGFKIVRRWHSYQKAI